MAKLTMSLMDVYHAMREAGIPCSPQRISAGIQMGAYPFGRVVSVGETGRRTLEIFRVDFEAWLASKMPEPREMKLAEGEGEPLAFVQLRRQLP